MKILMLNYEYPPLGGGQGNANKYIFEEFNKNYTDLQIDIITSSVDKEREETYPIGKIYFLDIGKQGKNLLHQGIKDLIVNSIKSFLLCRKIIPQNRYDLIVAWGGIPSLVRGTDVPFHEKKWHWLDTLFFQHFTPIVWKKAKKVIANSQLLKTLANQLSPKLQIDVIPNGVNIDFFTPNVEKKSDKIIILGVGRLAKIKGYDILLNAVSQLNTQYEVWLVGKGAEEENLRTQAKELGIENKVIFYGYKNKNELLSIYQQANIFCITSHNEGMSNALLEAISCGLPVISTHVGGSQELIQGNGFIIEKNDVNALLTALNDLIQDKNLMTEYAKKSRAIALTMSWENIANQLYQRMKE